MLRVYVNENGKTLVSKEELELVGWKEVIADSTDAAKEKHVPVVKKKCKTILVDVGSVAHPMTEAHLIEWIALETEHGYKIKYLTSDAVPAVTFSLTDGDKPVAVYAYCNLHGLWKA